MNNTMEHPVLVCIQCGRRQQSDGSWRALNEGEQNSRRLLSLEGLCPACAAAVSVQRSDEQDGGNGPLALGTLVRFLGGLEAGGKELSDDAQKQQERLQ